MSLPRFTFTERARPFMEVGYGDTRVDVPGEAAKWDVARWDTAPDGRWAGTEPTWQDISCDVFEATTEYGRTALTDRFVAGTAHIMADNATGWADPVMSGMRPGRAIRFGVDHVAYGRRILYRGFIDSVVPTYDPTTGDMVELNCIDALGEANRAILRPYTVAQGDGDFPNVRIASVLDRAHWPDTKRDLAPSSWELIAHEQGGQVADLMSQIADSVGGSLWGDHEARIAFRPRDWQMWPPSQDVDGTIGNGSETGAGNPVVYVQPDGTRLNYVWTGRALGTDWTADQVIFFSESSNEVCPNHWERPFDRASISTQVIMGRDAATAIVVDDPIGQALYGIEPFARLDLLTKDDDRLLSLARRALATRSHTTAPRVRSVGIDARNGDEQLDLLTTVDVFKPSHYRCRLIEDRGVVFDDRYIATAVSHTITASEWSLEMNLDLAAPYQASGGRWDGASWDQATWADASLPFDELAAAARSVLKELTHV